MEDKKSKEQYGNDFYAHLLEMYKLHTEMADRISQRRGITNNLYISIHTSLIGFLSYLFTNINNHTLIILLAVLGFVLSLIWLLNIFSYKKLNTAKFKALDELENNLPINFFKIEYDHYKKLKRIDFSDIESGIPVLLMFSYFIFIIFLICGFNQ